MQEALKQIVWVFWVFGLLAAAVGFDLALRGMHRYPKGHVWTVPGGDPGRGQEAIRHYGCGACHVIDGIRAATGRVGPPLTDFRERMYVAGVLPNTPENVAAWVRNPRAINRQTAMPDLGVTEEDARDIVAYLFGVP